MNAAAEFFNAMQGTNAPGATRFYRAAMET
jgi:hypothetical protein